MKSSLWHNFVLRSEHAWLNWMMLAVPVAFALRIAGAGDLAIFAASALAIVPLAGVMGEATEVLAERCGPTVGGLLNATMGNATELIIAFFALRAGHLEVVKASLSGSIIGNLLLVLGLSVLVGGIGREKQVFSRTAAGTNTTMLFIAVIALVMPAVFDLVVHGDLQAHSGRLQDLSLWTSAVLIAVYAISFLFVLKTHKSLFGAESKPHPGPKASLLRPVGALAVSTVLIGYMSELLVSGIESVTHTLGMTELFVGVIVVAIIGNAAEHSTAVIMARQGKMDIAVTISVGSSAQIALFVAPVLVFASVLIGKPMSLVFNAFEIAGIVVSVLVVDMIASDGETNWFEGVQLLGVYALLAVAFFFVPG